MTPVTPPLPLWVRIVDGLTVATAAIFLSNVLFDGFRLRVGDERITATSTLRTLIILLVLLGARHYFVRTPAVWTRLANWAIRVWHSPTTALVVPAWALSRFAVLLVGYLAVIFIGFPGSGAPPFRISRNELVNLPMRWDAGWYLGLAMDGYHFRSGSGRQENVAFFPTYPMVTRVGAALLGAHGGRANNTDGLNVAEFTYHQHRRIALAGMIVSLGSFAWALVYLFRLAREMLDDDAAAGAVAMCCAYPFSLFYSAFYTESVFLLTLAGTFYHFRRREWFAAAAWGLALGLTRPNGCLISVPLAVLALQQSLDGGAANVWWRRGASGSVDERRVAGFTAPLEHVGADGTAAEGGKVVADPDVVVGAGPARFNMARFVPAILVASMPGIGMLLFSGYLYSVSGNAFAWLEAHQAWGRVYEGVGGLFAGHAKLASEIGVYEYTQRQPVDLVNGAATIVALLLTWPVTRRLGLAYTALLLLMLLPPLAAGGFMSMGRVTSTLFPLFLYLGWRLRGTSRSTIVTACALLQGFFAALYWTWRPLF
jgi:Mannosyltransferase (PIG-V)